MTLRKTDSAPTAPQAMDEHARIESTLRQQAEAEEDLRERMAPSMELLEAIPPENTQRMLRELRVQQIELEMQNEHLRQSLEELDAARARYFSFYDLAPVGYVSVDQHGLITEANLTTANLLGVARETLLGQPFSRFIFREDADIFQQHRKQVLETSVSHACELRMVRHPDQPFWVQLEAIAVQEGTETPVYRVVVSDVSARKQAEEQLLKLAATLEERVDERTRQLRRISAQLTMTEERERRFLAEDLHDNLHQYLFAIRLRLGLLHPDSPRSSFDQIMEMVAQADHAARTITQQLSPPILHTLGLVPALEWLVGEKQRLFGLTVHFNHDACLKCSRPFTEEVQASLFRSVRELLVNVARHAGVSEARLSCACEDALTKLVVSDDGCGFDAAGTDGVWPVRDSFGLAHIYERIVAIGGTMDIVSSPGNGTTVALTIPHSVITKESQSS